MLLVENVAEPFTIENSRNWYFFVIYAVNFCQYTFLLKNKLGVRNECRPLLNRQITTKNKQTHAWIF
jgi:hypothetical protein